LARLWSLPISGRSTLHFPPLFFSVFMGGAGGGTYLLPLGIFVSPRIYFFFLGGLGDVWVEGDKKKEKLPFYVPPIFIWFYWGLGAIGRRRNGNAGGHKNGRLFFYLFYQSPILVSPSISLLLPSVVGLTTNTKSTVKMTATGAFLFFWLPSCWQWIWGGVWALATELMAHFSLFLLCAHTIW